MRIAYLDCFSGISGDMFLGALVDAGVPPELLQQTALALNVGAELEIGRVLRNGISSTKVDVIVNGEKDLPREEFWEKQREQSHQHEHRHADGTVHSHPHEHAHEHPEHEHSHGELHPQHHQHRGLREIREIIERAGIPEAAKRTALAIFQALGEAEAKVHDKDVETIHFHEVGSADAIIDIVCAAVGAHALGVDEWNCSALNVGGGVVHCAHGTLPVPAPATVELLRGAPVYSSGIEKELVTPTGAAIVKTLVKNFGEFPAMSISGSGFGAGSRDLKAQANVLRLTIGVTRSPIRSAPAPNGGTVSSGLEADESVTVLEATIDDMTPQVFGFVLERLLEEGALDAFGLPVQMKKSRPGMLLTVLSRDEDAQRLSELIFSETTTIGLRMRKENRITLHREWIPVETRWGTVRIKLAHSHNREMNAAPEFEDCRKLAIEHRVALKRVMQDAMRAYLEQKETAGTK